MVLMIHCKYCCIEIENHNDAGAHHRWCELNPVRIAFKKDKTLVCIRCNATFLSKFDARNKKYCSSACSRPPMSDERKKHLSEARKLFLKTNPDKHPWRNADKFKSVPCQRVKAYLLAHNIDFVEEIQPLTDRFYSIDIAFPHIKVGIEINGNQHYNADGSLTSYYQQRHDLIEAAGWHLIEVHYSRCFEEYDIQKILDFDITVDDSGLIQQYKEKAEEKARLKIINAPLPRGQKVKNKATNKWLPIKDEIFNHNIDFSKFGWAAKVASLMGISHQKVGYWMQRFHPEFYEASCFKRK